MVLNYTQYDVSFPSTYEKHNPKVSITLGHNDGTIVPDRFDELKEIYPNDMDLIGYLKYEQQRLFEESKCKKKERLYSYFVTFTLAPGVPKDKLMEVVTTSIPSRAALSVVHLEYVVEHETTNYHIHVYLKSQKRLKKDRFNHYQRYGHIDFRPVTEGTEADIQYYMNKEAETVTLTFD